MSLLKLLGATAVPAQVRGANLLIAPSQTLAAAGEFLTRLAERFPPLQAVSAGAETDGPYPELPQTQARQLKWLRKAQPRRVLLLGDVPHAAALSTATEAPCAWINARADAIEAVRCTPMTVSDPRVAEGDPRVQLAGDPLLCLARLPEASPSGELCERFREQHRTGRWIAYFAGTGIGEEGLAYGAFFKLARKKMGFLALAPRDPERYEPVYRDALKYRLPTNRHNRLSTSFVPLKTRVYYIEDPLVLERMYGCADVVIAGGTLSSEAGVRPDVLTPMLAGKPVVVGAAAGADPLTAAAVRDGAVIQAADEDALVEAAFRLLSDEAHRTALIEHARRWAEAQVGAAEKVLALL